jgi:hypothetical protein
MMTTRTPHLEGEHDIEEESESCQSVQLFPLDLDLQKFHQQAHYGVNEEQEEQEPEPSLFDLPVCLTDADTLANALEEDNNESLDFDDSERISWSLQQIKESVQKTETKIENLVEHWFDLKKTKS